MPQKDLLASLLGMGLIVFVAAWISAKPLEKEKPSIVLTAVQNGLEHQWEFVCSGKIHGYIRLGQTATGQHTLEGIWTLPNGRSIQHTRTKVDFPPPGRSTAYVWLTFPSEPAFGRRTTELEQERLSFHGPWRLDVRWDDKPLLSSSFTVTCH